MLFSKPNYDKHAKKAQNILKQNFTVECAFKSYACKQHKQNIIRGQGPIGAGLIWYILLEQENSNLSYLWLKLYVKNY